MVVLPDRSASSTAAQLQRGFKVYREVCQVCHGLTLLSFRNLAEPGGPGFTPAQVAAIAAEYKVKDEPNDQGEVKDRPGRPADRFPSPFPNEQAARARYNAVPPDMSVIAKARGYERGFPWFVFDMFTQYQEHGVDYIVALLTATRTSRRRASRSRPAPSTTSTFPATPSRCRRR